MLDGHAAVRKGRGTGDLIASIYWILECSKEFQKTVSLCFTDYIKPFGCINLEKRWDALKEIGMPRHLLS